MYLKIKEEPFQFADPVEEGRIGDEVYSDQWVEGCVGGGHEFAFGIETRVVRVERTSAAVTGHSSGMNFD